MRQALAKKFNTESKAETDPSILKPKKLGYVNLRDAHDPENLDLSSIETPSTEMRTLQHSQTGSYTVSDPATTHKTIKRTNSDSDLNKIKVKDPNDIPVLPPSTDHLAWEEENAKRILDWQYISAYLGLGAFGRRGLTTALLIVGVGVALSGVGLGMVVLFTFILMSIDIAYLSIFGHKDRFTITRNEIKLYQLQVEYWIKEHENVKNTPEQKSDSLANELKNIKEHKPILKIGILKELISDLKYNKEKHRIAAQDFVKITTLRKKNKKPWFQFNANFEGYIDLDAETALSQQIGEIAKRQGIDLTFTHNNIETQIDDVYKQVKFNLNTIREILNKLEADLVTYAEAIKEERISTKNYSQESLLKFSKAIDIQTQDLFHPYLSKLSRTENEINDKNQTLSLLIHDPLIRKLMVECKIDANLLADEYKKSKLPLRSLLTQHYFRLSAIFDNDNKKLSKLSRKLTFWQCIKVGFRGLSLSLVLAFIFDAMGVVSLSGSAFLLVGLVGSIIGLTLGLGNSFAQRNKDDLNLKYNDDADQYKEKDRRTKFICLVQILSAKLEYTPTRGLTDKTKASHAINKLKRDMLFKLIPIFFLVGSLSRRPLTLLKLMPYSNAFKAVFPIAIISVAVIVLLAYDIALSSIYIYRQRHSLDIYELSNPQFESPYEQTRINDTLDDKINEKLKKLAEIKCNTDNMSLSLSETIHPLTTIIGDKDIVKYIIYILLHPPLGEDLRNTLLKGFGPDPKLPEQYRDYHETRDEISERLDDLQVLKPTFREMSVGGNLPNLFTNTNLTTITIASVMSGLGISTLFPITIPVGLAIGFMIGVGLGLWMHHIDKRQDALQKQNIRSPATFHQTDIRRKLNDALDVILLNLPLEGSASCKPYRIRTLSTDPKDRPPEYFFRRHHNELAPTRGPMGGEAPN